jgi:serine protease Do
MTADDTTAGDTTADDITSTLTTGARHAVAAVAGAVVRIGRQGGRGNGIVIADGQVLTNAHNLRDRTTQVRFADGRTDQAEVVAGDADGDLVVLAVDTAGAAPVEWAPAAPGVGDVVYAVTRTSAGTERVTFGMVSGTDRRVRGPRGRALAAGVEHTAPLARGSSGSPLVDRAGRVAGLNTARLGDGFYVALPADDAFRERVDALARGEAPDRPILGIGVAPASVARALRASVGLPDRPGLLVRQVAADSPAAAGGVRPGDLVTDAAGQPVAEVEVLHRLLAGHDPAEPLVLHVVRGSEELDLEISFGAADDDDDDDDS